MFHIVSGRPAGNIYHFLEYLAASREQAEAALAMIGEEIASLPEWQRDNWLHGPHIFDISSDPCNGANLRAWDGYEEVPVPLWEGV